MVACLQILTAIVVVVLAVYYYFHSKNNFWKKLGVPGPKPQLLFGNFAKSLLGQKSTSDMIKKVYDETKHEPLVGVFIGTAPILIVNDLDMIRDVLISDFSHFASRGVPMYPKIENLSEHLFNLEPEIWRPLRAKLSPVFTSGKLKEMFPLLLQCGEHLQQYVKKISNEDKATECREIAAKYTTDVIGNCAFGIDMNALSEEDSEFRRMGRKIFTPSAKHFVRDIVRQFFPSLYKMIGHLLQPKDVTDFFTHVVTDTMKYRDENNVVRPDFINMLLELKKNPSNLENIELTDSLLTAQAFVFFLAGFETSSSTMGHTLYELALNPDIQDRLRAEIRERLLQNEKTGETLTYEHVKHMKYLNAVFQETLRKYPILPMLMRKVDTDYTFKGTKYVIPKNTPVWIPAIGIHRDPDIYPNPDVFDPERFTDNAMSTRHPMSFLAFGEGPRNCVGARFAYYQSKVGLISILNHCKVSVCQETKIPYESDNRIFLLTLKGGVMLKISKAD